MPGDTIQIVADENWKETYMSVLRDLGACEEARRHAYASNALSFADFWSSVERPDWLFWLAGRLLDRKLIVRAACACARTALQYVKPDEDRPRKAIEMAEAWTRDEATLAQVRDAAAYAADTTAAAYAAYADATAYAAGATAYTAAAYAAGAAASAAYADAYAADAAAAYAAAADAADAYAADAARKEMRIRILKYGLSLLK